MYLPERNAQKELISKLEALKKQTQTKTNITTDAAAITAFSNGH